MPNIELKNELLVIKSKDENTKNLRIEQVARKVYIRPDSKYFKELSHCNTCPVMYSCDKFMKDARCFFEIEAIKAIKQRPNNLLSDDPKKYLLDIEVTMNKLEQVINAHDNPNAKDMKDLMYMKMQLYKMKYDKPNQTNIQVNTNVQTVDIKKIMAEMRKDEKPFTKSSDKVIDVSELVASNIKPKEPEE